MNESSFCTKNLWYVNTNQKNPTGDCDNCVKITGRKGRWPLFFESLFLAKSWNSIVKTKQNTPPWVCVSFECVQTKMWIQCHHQQGRCRRRCCCERCVTCWNCGASSRADTSSKMARRNFCSLSTNTAEAKHNPENRKEKGIGPDMATSRLHGLQRAGNLQTWPQGKFPLNSMEVLSIWRSGLVLHEVGTEVVHPCRATHYIQEGYASSNAKPRQSWFWNGCNDRQSAYQSTHLCIR